MKIQLCIIFVLSVLVSCNRNKLETNYKYYTADDISDDELDEVHQESSLFISDSITTLSTDYKEDPSLHYLPKCIANQSEEIIHREGYSLSYNSKTKLPNWVYWELIPSRCEGSFTRLSEFFPDTEIKSGSIAYNEDYRSSIYERGHMCPAADNKYSKKAMEDSFILSNICPQTHELNGGDWRLLEEKCRKWVKIYSKLFIVCGPIIETNNIYDTIGEHSITVPEHFYKIIMRIDKDGEPLMLGFIYNNDKTSKNMRDYVVPVDKIEELTGIDFFSFLSDSGTIAESKIDLSNWSGI